jgi:hypothetical protein
MRSIGVPGPRGDPFESGGRIEGVVASLYPYEYKSEELHMYCGRTDITMSVHSAFRVRLNITNPLETLGGLQPDEALSIVNTLLRAEVPAITLSHIPEILVRVFGHLDLKCERLREVCREWRTAVESIRIDVRMMRIFDVWGAHESISHLVARLDLQDVSPGAIRNWMDICHTQEGFDNLLRQAADHSIIPGTIPVSCDRFINHQNLDLFIRKTSANQQARAVTYFSVVRPDVAVELLRHSGLRPEMFHREPENAAQLAWFAGRDSAWSQEYLRQHHLCLQYHAYDLMHSGHLDLLFGIHLRDSITYEASMSEMESYYSLYPDDRDVIDMMFDPYEEHTDSDLSYVSDNDSEGSYESE